MYQPKINDCLSVVYVGMGGNAYLSKNLEPIIKKCGMKLIIISEWDSADIKWNRDTYLRDMASCDISICPQNVELQPAKSNVKLVSSLSLGMPTICSPLPAYLEIAKHNENALIASTPEEWEKCLLQLKDYNERVRFSKAAKESVKNYSPQAIATRWKDLLSKPSGKPFKIAFINNTLHIKYLSYGDYWLEAFRAGGHQVDEFRYESVQNLPSGYDLYFFIEKRYQLEDIADVHPRVLYSLEDNDLNILPHYDYILSGSIDLVNKWKERGFVNVSLVPNYNHIDSIKLVFEAIKKDISTDRKKHNQVKHTKDINAFQNLMAPEARWGGGNRDREHIRFTDFHTKAGDNVLDIGSADGWLSLYLAKKGCQVTALDIVDRGIQWTLDQAVKLGVTLGVCKGFIEDAPQIFVNKKFDIIILYEILEHLDYLQVPQYLSNLEKLLSENGKILISLPKQDLRHNTEHLWTPSDLLITRLLSKKPNLKIDWMDIPNHEVPGNWFISYGRNQTPDYVTKKEVLKTKQNQVDIIIPSYKNLPYLKLTLDSIRKNTTNYQIVVVNSGPDIEVRNYLRNQSDIKLIDFIEKGSFSRSTNLGIQSSSNDVVLLNNDVIVGPGWLDELRLSPFDITNPFSNCDLKWIHNYEDTVGGITLRPNMTIPEVNVDALFDAKSLHSEIIPRPWVAFYATYIKRKVIENTGLLDESFLNGGEDYDYCRRAVKQGFTCGHKFSSFVFHFGGKTRKVSETENVQQHQIEDQANQKIMKHKDRPTLAIFTGPGWEKWDIRSLNTTGIGGSETCAAMLADQFAKMGYRSVIIGDCEEITIDGVEYIPWQKFDSFKNSNYIDYFISSRTTAPLDRKIKNGVNLVWVHDIWLSQNKQVLNMDKVDKFVCLSPWHVDFFSNHHGIPKDKIIIQDNGFDTSLYENKNIERDPFRLFYSSSPDRGLDTLLQMFPAWKQRFPKLNLHIYYGFDNWKKALQQRNNPQEKELMDKILRLMKQDGVIYHGRVSQKELATEQLKSSLWVYPTNFFETFCLTSTQSMLAGAIPITTNVAALQTTIPESCGIKISSVEECTNQVIRLLENPQLQESYRKNGQEYAKKFSWTIIAKQWEQKFQSLSK